VFKIGPPTGGVLVEKDTFIEIQRQGRKRAGAGGVNIHKNMNKNSFQMGGTWQRILRL
jgi:hypothetical protein